VGLAGQNEENKSILIHMSQIPDWPWSLVHVNLWQLIANSRDGFTGGRGVCTPLALARGGAGGGVLFFMIKQTIIRDKMRYSILSNNMMISKL
jgi:hypothetical protein